MLGGDIMKDNNRSQKDSDTTIFSLSKQWYNDSHYCCTYMNSTEPHSIQEITDIDCYDPISDSKKYRHQPLSVYFQLPRSFGACVLGMTVQEGVVRNIINEPMMMARYYGIVGGRDIDVWIES
jgi:hypothetical protein